MVRDLTAITRRHNFTDRVMELFPDGAPSDGVREAIINTEITSLLNGNKEKTATLTGAFVTIDNKKKYHVKSPMGFDIDAQAVRDGWDIVFSSPVTLEGKRIRRRFTNAGEKFDAMFATWELLNDFTTVKEKMKFLARMWEGKADSEVPEAFVPARQQMDDDVDTFDSLYRTYQLAESRSAHINFDYLEIKARDLSGWTTFVSSGLNHVEFLATVALHVIWIEKYEERLGGQVEMAKNKGGASWWLFYGAQSNLNKARKTLGKKSHLIVEGKDCLYLYIQDAEIKFVNGFLASNSLRAKMVDEPAYHETLCGKRQVDEISQNHHESRCRSCQRERSNQKLAKESALASGTFQAPPAPVIDEPVPDFRGRRHGTAKVVEVTPRKAGKLVNASPRNVNKLEDAEYERRNGEVITVQGPQETTADDYMNKAKENRRVADELMEQAAYYEKVAQHYEAMLQPTRAVQDAEEAMAEAMRKAQETIDAARAKEEADRKAQEQELEALIASGPPAR